MNLKNSNDNYDLITKTLHWLTAFLFLGAYISVYYRHWFTNVKTPENWSALQLHLSFGISIGVFVLLRIIWRLLNTQPSEEPGTPLEHKLAKIGHYVLYAIMIVTPITGYLGTGVATEFFFLFDITQFPDTWVFTHFIAQGMEVNFIDFEKPIDFIHKDVLGHWLVWLLILGHVLAALYHHLVKKDRTLKKMLFNH
ncbi:cytochrome b [Pseudoalteromonas sp. SG43-3]|uniref:cytochrome b n=1 Tax=Pseudoalteromonas sp. SG43-3 TaxID=2760970 RepID=UPI0016046E7D|nr:cytochrome b [Pseudoalteromonas sp. SG43-3]MBB1442377.1 cytochrome b [Pseudoalteromonas sp. SG43-3]|tara:strand:- start:2245 stop:2832 length:588 start_codon:yes stop_codon:yes gene_type:complete